MQGLTISQYKTPEEAPKFNEPEFKGVFIKEANIVYQGTEEGNPTYDFILQDKDGNKYVALITARLIRQLVNATIFVDVDSISKGGH